MITKYSEALQIIFSFMYAPGQKHKNTLKNEKNILFTIFKL